MLCNDHAAILIDPRNFGHVEIHILIVLEELARGIGNLRSGKHRRTHLVEQRLKEMIVMPIHQCNTHILVGEFLCETHAAESGTDDDNMLLICHNDPTPCCIVKKIT